VGGAFFDAGVDFLLVFSGILGCTMLGMFSYWVLCIILLVFLQFLVGFKNQKPVYDPIGKLFGIFSLLIVPLILIFPAMSVIHLESAIILLGGLSILGRRLYLYHEGPEHQLKLKWKRMGDKNRDLLIWS